MPTSHLSDQSSNMPQQCAVHTLRKTLPKSRVFSASPLAGSCRTGNAQAVSQRCWNHLLGQVLRHAELMLELLCFTKSSSTIWWIDDNLCLKPAVVRGEDAVCFITPYTRATVYNYSFFPPAVRLWYSIPAAMTYLPLSSLRSSLATTQLN